MALILHVIASADPAGGGPIEGIRQIAGALGEAGHEIHIATCDDPAAPWIKELPFVVHALGPARSKFGYTPNLLPWLLENAGAFDAVIVNGIWQFNSLATRRAMRKLDRPYLVFTHGMLDPYFKRAFPLKHLKKCLYWPWGEYRNLRDAAAVLFTCEDEKLLARQSFSLYRANEQVVNYGTAGPLGNPDSLVSSFYEAFPKLEERPFLLFLSRIHPKKACDTLLQAFAKVVDLRPELDLVMAGPDQVGWKRDLERLAASLKIQDRVHWSGMLTGDVKWGAYFASEAFILPSHQENFGIVVAEALACGKPVLISDKVNIWREIVDAGAGFVEPDTLEGTERLLLRWIETSEPSRIQLSERARQCFLDHFEITKAAESLMRVIEEVKR